MAEPQPRRVSSGYLGWVIQTEAEARRYAALPVLIETIREACDQPRCGFCGGVDGRSPKHTDCPGIAALKAAGVET